MVTDAAVKIIRWLFWMGYCKRNFDTTFCC